MPSVRHRRESMVVRNSLASRTSSHNEIIRVPVRWPHSAQYWPVNSVSQLLQVPSVPLGASRSPSTRMRRVALKRSPKRSIAAWRMPAA